MLFLKLLDFEKNTAIEFKYDGQLIRNWNSQIKIKSANKSEELSLDFIMDFEAEVHKNIVSLQKWLMESFDKASKIKDLDALYNTKERMLGVLEILNGHYTDFKAQQQELKDKYNYDNYTINTLIDEYYVTLHMSPEICDDYINPMIEKLKCM